MKRILSFALIAIIGRLGEERFCNCGKMFDQSCGSLVLCSPRGAVQGLVNTFVREGLEHIVNGVRVAASQTASSALSHTSGCNPSLPSANAHVEPPGKLSEHFVHHHPDRAQRMIFPHAHLRRQVTEHTILLLIVSCCLLVSY